MDDPTRSPRTLTRIRSKLRFLWPPRSSSKKASSMREPSFARLPSTATEESKERKTRARKIKRGSSPEEAEEQENIDQSGAKTTPSSSVVPMPENEELQGIDKVEPTLREAREEEITYTSIDGEEMLKPLPIPQNRQGQMESQKEQGQEISDGKSERITSSPPLLVLESENKKPGENVKEEPKTMLVREGQERLTKEKVKIIPPMPMAEVRHEQKKSTKEEEEKQETSGHETAKTTSSPLPVTKQANEESRLGGIGKVEPTMQETREVQERQTSSHMKLERMPDSLPETKQGQMESREKVQKASDSDSSKITASHHLLVPNLAEEESDRGGMSTKKTPMMEVTEGQESGKIKEEKIVSPSMPDIAERQMERRQKQPEQEISGHKRAKITPDLPIPMMANKEHELVETNKEEPTNMEAMHEEEKYTSKRTVELIPPEMPETEKSQMENNEKEHGVYKTDKEEVKMMDNKIQGIDRSDLEKDNLMQEKKVEEEIQTREQLLPTTRISARSDPTGERNSKDPNTSITREEHSMSKTELERASMFKSNSETNKELKALDKSVKDSHRSNSGMDNIASTSHMPALSKEEIQIGRQRPRGMVITEEHEKIIIEKNNMNVENNDKGEASGANISGTYSLSSILAPTMRDGEDEGNKPYPTSESKSIDEDAGHRNKEVKSQGRDKGESTSNGRSAWTTIGVIAMIAGIMGLGPMVLMKRLEKVRRQKHA